MDAFTLAYIEAALWSTMDNTDDQGGEPLDANYSLSDIAPDTMTNIVEDCRKFQQVNDADIGDDYDQAGHDFWLTRNRHGAGYWNGDWPDDAGERLTAASHAFGEFDLYVGDDGLIYGNASRKRHVLQGVRDDA